MIALLVVTHAGVADVWLNESMASVSLYLCVGGLCLSLCHVL